MYNTKREMNPERIRKEFSKMKRMSGEGFPGKNGVKRCLSVAVCLFLFCTCLGIGVCMRVGAEEEEDEYEYSENYAFPRAF